MDSENASLTFDFTGAMAGIVASMRPKQWIKNLIVFAGLIFSRHTFDWPLQLEVWVAFLCFCSVSSAGYIINDVIDRDSDQSHPVKCTRPIASGRLGTTAAGVTSIVLVLAAMLLALAAEPLLSLFLLGYLALQLFYSLALKHQVIIDVLAVSGGFVIRAMAGAAVISVVISPWLIVCTMLLALFLGLAKRHAELILLEEGAANHRRNLELYNKEMVQQMMVVTASATLVSYSLYSFTASSKWMMLTIPFVLYGIFRYMFLAERNLKSGAPEQALLTDMPLLINVALWVITAEAVLHFM